jgi:apolipoprotein N-acyltransferase
MTTTAQPPSRTVPADGPGSVQRAPLVHGGLLAVAAGLCGWAAHPPVNAWWLVFLVVPLMLAALDRAAVAAGPERLSGPRLVGFSVGALTFFPMLVWLVPPAGFAAWIALSAGMSAWWMLMAEQLRRWVRSPWVVLVAPVIITGIESWRARVPMHGFGWGSLAYPHVEGSPLLPVARLVGETGLIFVTATLGALAWWGVVRVLETSPDEVGESVLGWLRPPAVPVTALAAVVAVPVLLPLSAPAPDAGRSIDVLAVQGNDLYGFDGPRIEEREIITAQMLEETRSAIEAGGPADLVVWPESAIDRDPFRPGGAFLRPYVEEAVEVVGDGDLLAGVILDGEDPTAEFVNAGLVLGPGLQVTDEYVKRQLVPFGEFVPFRPLLGDRGPFRQVPRDAVPGEGPATVRAAGTDVAVIICFETLFGDIVRSNIRAADGEAGLLVAITNDASFGQSAESDQHVAQSRLRAVESGRWAVHAALSGGSALIDPDGRLHAETGLFERATIRADVPLVTGSTPYLVLGDVVGWTARWAVLALVVADLWRRRRERHQVATLPAARGHVA